jgi:predicted NBD/HSP70 family sugar kinase
VLDRPTVAARADLGFAPCRSTATNNRDVRRGNRSALLSLLFPGHAATRAAMGQQLDLSTAAVSTIVTELLAAQLIRADGAESTGVGRPIERLSLNPDAGYFFGLAAAAGALTVDLYDVTLCLRASRHVRLEDRAALAARLRGTLTSVLDDEGVQARHLLGVGLSLPPAMEQQAEVGPASALVQVVEAVSPWPVRCEPEGRARALTETWCGAGDPGLLTAVITLDHGIGLGICREGQLWGPPTLAEGWAHAGISMAAGRACSCGSRRCLQARAGAPAVAARYGELLGLPSPTSQTDVRAGILCLAGASAADPAANEVLDELAVHLGAGIANLVNLLAVQRVVLAGWMAQALVPRLLPRLAESVQRSVLLGPLRDPGLVMGTADGAPASLGAALLPASGLFQRASSG